MFDLSLAELGLIALVALLVLGPEKLPRAARTAGLYLRRARQAWYSVKSDIERELAADELRRSIDEQKAEAVEAAKALRRESGADAIRDELEATGKAATGPRDGKGDAR